MPMQNRSRLWISLLLLWLPGCTAETEYPGASQAISATRFTAAGAERTIRVASFNIQAFGQSKLSKPHVMRVLAEIVRQFDVIAVQEIRSKDQDVIPRLLSLVNSDGSAYSFTIGPRLGRTASKEQYAFLYDTTTLHAFPESVQTMPDPGDRLHREPLLTRFQVVGGEFQGFSFLLMNVHTDPDEVDPADEESEINVLAEYFAAARSNAWSEDDVILLGDLNADSTRLGRLGSVPNLMVLMANMTTNVRANRQYDHILIDRAATTEFTGRAGVMDVQRAFDLTREQALEISDHYPVWAEFSAAESVEAGPLAVLPAVAEVPR